MNKEAYLDGYKEASPIGPLGLVGEPLYRRLKRKHQEFKDTAGKAIGAKLKEWQARRKESERAKIGPAGGERLAKNLKEPERQRLLKQPGIRGRRKSARVDRAIMSWLSRRK